jgi:predicted DsbA family dithiol-disulfide isomerase
MHDKLLEKSPDLSRDQLIAYAGEVGLDTEKFTADLDAMKHKARIDKDVDMALTLDFYNTPTFVINGRVVIGNVPYKHLRKVVEEELTRAGS